MIVSILRKAVIAGGATIALGCAPAQAQLFGGLCTVIDPLFGVSPCSGLSSQLLQYARQLEQLKQEVTTAIQEVVNTVALPSQTFQDASGEISQILNIARKADLLGGNTGQFITNLSAGSYPIGPLNNPMAEIVKEQNAVALATKQLGSLIAVENPHIASQAAIVAAINDQNMTADGRLKALQASGQLAATSGQQLHGMETILLGMAQGQHATMLADQDRLAMQYKALDVMSTYTTDIPPGTGF